jgi:hypothetical protein
MMKGDVKEGEIKQETGLTHTSSKKVLHNHFFNFLPPFFI